MKGKKSVPGGKDHAPQQGDTIEAAVLDVLKAYNIPLGGPIDLIRIKYELQQNGIGLVEVSSAVVRLLERQLLTMQGNAFHLTARGFKALVESGAVQESEG